MSRLILITLSFLLPTSLWAETKVVPTEYSTIQEAIDAASAGDTVLVLEGTYIENINFLGKNIFLTSLILLDGDTSFISKTIIDGNAAGSVVLFESGEDTTAVLNGFTITNGVSVVGGGGIRVDSSSSPILRNLYIHGNRAAWLAGGGIYGDNGSNVKIENVVLWNNRAQTHGGGIYFRESDPYLLDVIVKNNISDGAGGGILFSRSDPTLKDVIVKNNRVLEGGSGGIYFGISSPSLENVTITGNSATTIGGGVTFWNSTPTFDPINRSNIYLNHAPSGSDLYSNLFSVVNIVVDTFSVMIPSDLQATPIDSFTFDILNSIYEQSESDLYVSPDGDDTNGGLSAGDPLETITFALSKILADSLTPHTIYLSNGTYSPSSNGEHFPLFMRDFVSLSGETQSGVILNAEGTGSVIILNGDDGITLSNMTVSGGRTSRNGGGISAIISDPILENITISGNSAVFQGGGIYFGSSNPTLSGVTVSYNRTSWNGGGIYIDNSNVIFDGGNRSNIFLNYAGMGPGSDLYSQFSPNIDVVLDTFTVIKLYDSYASPRYKFTFDILNAKVESVISTDAIILTIRSQGGIHLDSSLAWKFQTALEGSYQVVDTVQYIHARQPYEPTRLQIKTSEILASAWKRDDLLTGDHYIDSLGMEYNLIDVRHDVFTSRPGFSNLFLLFFREPLQMSRLGNEYEKHPEVAYAEPSGFGGAGNDIIDFTKYDSTYLVFSRGWGDCFSGCIYRHYWYVAVDSIGNAVDYGEAGSDSIPLIPIWNIPGRYNMSQFLTADSVYDVILNAPKWWIRRHAIEGLGWLFKYERPPLTNEVDSIWYEMKADVMERIQETFFVLHQAQNDSDLDVRESASSVFSNIETLISADDELTTSPDVFNLHQNYPNPFNPTTTIEYSLPKSGDVTLIVYNIVGQEVARLVNGVQKVGNHIIKWNASHMASGIYFYRLQAGNFVQTKKMVLLK